ncbi:hypothetical protein V493_00937 [Pseudogymnoascus sp. VKM F-4281 (FW-2241)]|nr:hypothetical protein V493_00937 [Pseudogymnoascus sp. VKM F-4281 (FW-2241)]
MHTHPDPSFFTSLLPEYMSSVYPVNPVITESEVRHCIERIGSDRDGTSFLYAYAAVTINLSRIDTVQFAPDIREQIGDLLTKSFEHRDQLGLSERPTMLRVMSSLFIEICLMGLRKPDLAFTYLRETISLLYMLHVDKPEVMSSLPPHERVAAHCDLADGHFQHPAAGREPVRVAVAIAAAPTLERATTVPGAYVARSRRDTRLRYPEQAIRDHKYHCRRRDTPATSFD